MTQVGPGKWMPNQIPGTTQSSVSSTPITLNAGSIAKIEGILGSKLTGVGNIPIVPKVNFNLLESLNDTQLKEIAKILKAMNYTVKNSKGDVKRLFQTEEVLKSIISTGITTFPDLRNALMADYLPGQEVQKETLPSRTVTKVNPVVFGQIIDDIYVKNLKRKATKEEIDVLVKEYTPKLEGGTLTEVAKKKNPKTGKLESVTTITPSMNQQEAEISIEQRLKEMNPDELDVAKRIDFNSWINKNVMSI